MLTLWLRLRIMSGIKKKRIKEKNYMLFFKAGKHLFEYFLKNVNTYPLMPMKTVIETT